MIKMEKLKEQVNDYMLRSETVMQYEQDKYTVYQNYLYKRALYGFGKKTVFSQKEIDQMCKRKKQRITNVHRRAQKVLNLTKQHITNIYSNDIFQYFFPNSKLTKELIELTEIDEKFNNNLNFKDLLLTKDDIISIFIEQGVLPKNFLSLKEKPISLPSLKNESKT